MSYIGVQPGVGQYRKLDDISGSFNGATTTFTTSVDGINVTAGSPQQLLVSVGGVIQQPVTDYSTSTNSITFSTAPAGGLDFFAVLMGDAINVGIPSDGSITSAKLNSDLTIDLASGTAGAPSLTFDSDTGLYSPGADEVGIATNGTAAVTVDSSQRVGIGTTSPSSKLSIATAANSPALDITDASTSDFIITPGVSSGVCRVGPATGAMALYTGNSERARIDSSGRLLVGTSSTSSNAIAIIQGESSISSPARLYLTRRNTASAASDELGVLHFSDSNHGSSAEIKARRDGGTWTPGVSLPSRLEFSTTADGASSPTERMRIKNNGTIIFGDGAGGFDGVNGGASFTSGTSARMVLNLSSASTGTMILQRFYNPNGQVGSIVTDGSSTAFNTSSDYRLKENVTPVTDGITRLQQLKPSRFNFIADPTKTVDGFLAHEVQTIVPEAITGEKDAVDDNGDPVYQGIDQSKLVPLLTAALQEAIGRIETLEAEVTTLKAS